MLLYFFIIFFFFSSRRRHTRSLCDWSSGVCSSDLVLVGNALPGFWFVALVGQTRIVSSFADEIRRLPSGENATDRKSTRLNSSHTVISYAVFCLKKKKTKKQEEPRQADDTDNDPST